MPSNVTDILARSRQVRARTSPSAIDSAGTASRLSRLALHLRASSRAPAAAQTLLLKDGRTLEGRLRRARRASRKIRCRPKTTAGEVPVTPLIVVDDGLRRTFIHSIQVQQVLEHEVGRDVRINIWQPVAERGGGVGRIGRATQRHAVRRIRPAHLRNAKHRGPARRSCRASRRSRRCTPRSKASAAARGRSSGTCGSPPAASRATRSTASSRRP